ncbi:hypothetical protein RHCRD62_60444 [Rhodococcus sp. RD6.2]|nr:hypothetical protein RHCRD62_60444 [Rhodococcus sp. RD6.2]
MRPATGCPPTSGAPSRRCTRPSASASAATASPTCRAQQASHRSSRRNDRPARYPTARRVTAVTPYVCDVHLINVCDLPVLPAGPTRPRSPT